MNKKLIYFMSWIASMGFVVAAIVTKEEIYGTKWKRIYFLAQKDGVLVL